MYIKSQTSKDRACDLIQALSPTRAWEVVVKPYAKKRSSPQNRYLHGVVLPPIMEYTGMDDITQLRHELCCLAFGYETKTIGDRTADVPLRTTSDLSTEEFEAFCAWCRMWAMRELGVLIKEPNEP